MEREFELDGRKLMADFDYHDGEPATRDNPGCPDWIELNSVSLDTVDGWARLSGLQLTGFFYEYGGGYLAKGKADFEHDCIKHAQEVYTNGQY